MGDRAILAEVGSLDEVLALHARLAASRPAGVIDLVPAARTVLIAVDPAVLPLAAARAWAEAAPDAAAAAAGTRDVELPIVYDGADLAGIAELLGVSVDELVRRHREAAWTVAFTGFAPGFGYLVSADWPFDVPRLATPRTRVPAGSVGLAAGFTGAYPRETPGGWRLIGTTSAPLFDPDPGAQTPVLLAPGTRVRFTEAPPARPVSAASASTVPSASASPAPSTVAPAVVTAPGTPAVPPGPPGEGDAIEVVEPGLLLTVQDLGRPGQSSRGIARSGAWDRAALRTANRLAGNPEHAAALEVTMGGCRLRAARDLVAVVAGAWGPITLDGRSVDPYEPISWPAGAELHLDWFVHGARAYLAVRGGLEVAVVAGSRATDVLAGLGEGALRPGAVLAVGPRPSTPVPIADVHPWSPLRGDVIEVELAPGPRAEWFAASAHRALFEGPWTVSNAADRVGIRLDGPELARTAGGAAELPSEGMVPGSLQMPPSGRPTILGPDGPVTGGYPVIAVVADGSLDLLAQARPGTRLRFRHARQRP